MDKIFMTNQKTWPPNCVLIVYNHVHVTMLWVNQYFSYITFLIHIWNFFAYDLTTQIKLPAITVQNVIYMQPTQNRYEKILEWANLRKFWNGQIWLIENHLPISYLCN